MIEDFTIQTRNLLDRLIVDNEVTISEIPEVQISDLLLEHDELFEQFKNNNK